MSSRADRVKELFQQALDLPEAEQGPFLAEHCGADDGVRREVEGLLAALAEATGFLSERPPPPGAEGPGTVIDRYRLAERIGEGGFGVVWRAEQEKPLRREVAIKILKLGMDTRAVVARFERERQALARMQHPGIAAVFDGGTTPSGRPYFVMELVRGLPIARYCRERGLGIGERVELMLGVCMAVQHAHQKGLAHRDLKPGNILVTEDERGTPQAKVIDFGIAKVLDPDTDDGAAGDGTAITFSMTRAGQPIGTLEYMAPEQAAGDLAQVDSRVDVYALGVVLYELLTGRRPFERGESDTQSPVDFVQRIREQPVTRPSARVAAGDRELPLPGADRQRWSRRLAEGLDWIAARALEKDPNRRYPTPNALATDLQAFLDGLPVAAGPPDRLYALRCFVARHRMLVFTATLLVVSLVVGIVATAMALSTARAETRHKQRTLAATVELLHSADPLSMRGPDYTVREMLDAFAGRIETNFADDPQVAFDLNLTVGAAYRNLAQLEASERHLRRALELAAAGADRDLRARGVAHMEYGGVLRELGRYDAARAQLDRAIALWQAAGLPAVEIAEIELLEADLHRLCDETEAGAALAQRAMAVLDAAWRRGGRVTADLAINRAFGRDLLGAFCQQRWALAEARAHYEAALEIRKAVLAEEHPLLATSWANLASVALAAGDLDAAEAAGMNQLEVHRRTVGEAHPKFAAALTTLGRVALRRGQLAAARDCFTRARTIREAALPAGHDANATSRSDLADVALAAKAPAEAEAHLRAAIELRAGADVAPTRFVASLWARLGVAVDRQGRKAEAAEHYERAAALHRELGGEQNPGYADALHNLALVLVELDRAGEALALHRRVLAMRQRYRPDDLDDLEKSQIGIGIAAGAAGDGAAAAAALLARVELHRRRGADPQAMVALQARAARAFLDVGDAASAAPLAAAAYEWCCEHLAAEWPRGECASLLSECRRADGEWAEATALAAEAVEILRGSPAPADRLQRAQRNLAAARRGAEGDR